MKEDQLPASSKMMNNFDLILILVFSYLSFVTLMHIAKAQRDVLQKVIERTIKMVNNYSPELSLDKHCEKYQVS